MWRSNHESPALDFGRRGALSSYDRPVKKRAAWVGPALLALLTCVGQVKEHPLLRWIEWDLTVITTGLVLLAMLQARIRLGPTTGRIMAPVIMWAMFLPAIAIASLSAYSVTKIGILFTITLVLAVGPFYLLREPEQRQAFIYALAGISVAVTLLALSSPQTSASYTNRLVLEGADTIGTARVAMTGAIILALLAFQPGLRAFWRLVFVVLAGVTAMLGVLSGSRGPVVAGVATILAVIVIAPSMSKYRGRALFGSAALVAVVVWIAVRSDSDGLDRIASALLGEESTSSSARSMIWQDAWGRILSTPWGAGWGDFAAAGEDQYRYPHNLLLEIGVEAGLPILIFFVGFLVATLIRGIHVATAPAGTVLLALFLFSLANAMVSSDINGTRLLWVAMFAIWVMPTAGSRWHYVNDNQLASMPATEPVDRHSTART